MRYALQESTLLTVERRVGLLPCTPQEKIGYKDEERQDESLYHVKG